MNRGLSACDVELWNFKIGWEISILDDILWGLQSCMFIFGAIHKFSVFLSSAALLPDSLIRATGLHQYPKEPVEVFSSRVKSEIKNKKDWPWPWSFTKWKTDDLCIQWFCICLCKHYDASYCLLYESSYYTICMGYSFFRFFGATSCLGTPFRP